MFHFYYFISFYFHYQKLFTMVLFFLLRKIERLGTTGVWKSHYRLYTHEDTQPSRVVRDWHNTPRFNVSQTLNVAVSRCVVIPEWPCSMLGHEGTNCHNWEGIITSNTMFVYIFISDHESKTLSKRLMNKINFFVFSFLIKWTKEPFIKNEKSTIDVLISGVNKIQ